MEEAKLLIIGNVNVDLVLGKIDKWPDTGTETILPMSDFRPGGSAGNTALALKGLGKPFTLLSAVGNDDIGAWLSSKYGEDSICWPKIEAPTTITTGIIHQTSERTFFTSAGHLEEFSVDHILPFLDMGSENSIALLSGVFLSSLLKANYNLLIDRLIELNYDIAIDPGWPSEGWSDSVCKETYSWFEKCTYILINDKEVCGITRENDLQKALAIFSEKLPEQTTIVIKNGPKGACLHFNGRTERVDAPNIDPFDTIGAGDCFNAGFLSHIGNGYNEIDALQAGVLTASNAIGTFPRSYKDIGSYKNIGSYKDIGSYTDLETHKEKIKG